MRFALLYDNGKIAVEIKEKDFLELFSKYIAIYGSPTKALEKIKDDMKVELRKL